MGQKFEQGRVSAEMMEHGRVVFSVKPMENANNGFSIVGDLYRENVSVDLICDSLVKLATADLATDIAAVRLQVMAALK